MEIPEQLKNINLRFCKIQRGKKNPYEKDWTNKEYNYEDITPFLETEQYGVVCGKGNLIVIDADRKELQEAIINNLPDTFRVKTGSRGTHNYFFCPEATEKIVLTTKITNNEEIHYGEVQGKGSQVVGPGSLHPNGNTYEVSNDKPIATISAIELLKTTTPFTSILETQKEHTMYEQTEFDKEISKLNVLDIFGKEGLKQNGDQWYGKHPIHGSETGSNFWIDPIRNVWHCFRHGSGGGPLYAIAVKNGIIGCEEAKKGILRGEKAKQTIKLAQDKYKVKLSTTMLAARRAQNLLDKREIAEKFYEIQPFFYDTAKLLWLWDTQENCWKKIDETDLLNALSLTSNADTIDSKEKTEFMEAIRQVGRLKKPKDIKKTWVQFKNIIVDVETLEQFIATPEYFVANPIPWNIGETEDTPNMDRIFKEWVVKEKVQDETYIQSLYEIISFCTIPWYFINRLFCLIGPGSNGKSCFLRIIDKFVGTDNVTTTELDDLLTSRFERAKLFKKTVCIMGETNFNHLKKSSIIKKLTGEDKLGVEFKNKTPFDNYNYAKILIGANGLPYTEDQTDGFYRRWFTIDFPNKFTEEKNILADIPDIEYNNLARKCIRILNNLIKIRKFTNEGSIEERKLKFEQKSNPIGKFIEDVCNKDDSKSTPFLKFFEAYNEYIKQRGYRPVSKVEMSRTLIRDGYEIKTERYIKPDNFTSTRRVISGLELDYGEKED